MAFRTATFGTDLCVRPTQVQQALRRYQTLTSQRQGQLIFLSGAPGSGRSDTLQAIAESLRHAQPRPKVIAGQFVNGHYTPWNITPTTTLPLTEIAAAVGETISLIPGLASFIGQILQAGAATWEVVESVTKQAAPAPDALKHLLRRTAQAQPIVYLLDDLDAAEGSGWASLLLDFAAEVHAELPLLFFLTLEGQAELGPHEEDEPDLFFIARRLTARGLAEWWHLPPLSRDEIAAWIGPAAPGMAQHLHHVTSGHACWMKQLWRDWQERGVVTYAAEAARWQWGADGTPSLNLVKDLLDDRLRKLLADDSPALLEQTRTLLACAALEGQRFTAEAIARMMGWEPDEVIDLCDDYLTVSDERPDGILLEVGSSTIEDPQTGPRTLWHYAFVNDLHWHALQSRYVLTAAEQRQISLALAHTLLALYEPEAQRIARTLARLFRIGGDETAARNHQRTADFAISSAALRQQVQLILTTNKDDWDKDRYRRATWLLRTAGEQMLKAYPYEETLSVFEAAHQMACRSGVIADQADALYYCGHVRWWAGDYLAARAPSSQALKMSQQINYRAGEVAAWHQLASIDLKVGDYTAARASSSRALEIARQIGYHKFEAGAWYNLALIDLEVGDYTEARERFNHALKMQKHIGDRKTEGGIWHNLATIDFNVGDYAAAREKFNRALEIEQQTGNRAGEAATFYLLGVISWETGRRAEGARLVALSYVLNQSIGHSKAQIASRNFAEKAEELGYDEARVQTLLAEVVAAYQQDGGAGLVRAAFGE